MKRRLLSLLCVICLLLTMLPTSVFAAEYSAPTLNIGASYNAADKQVTVKVTLGACSDLGGLDFHLKYETKKLTVVEVEGNEEFGNEDYTTISKNADNIGLSFVKSSGLNVLETKLVLTAVFAVVDERCGNVAFSFDSLTTNFAHKNGDDTSSTPGVGSVTSTTTTIPKPSIASVTASVDQPVKGAALDTTVDLGGATAYTGAVQWYEGSSASGAAVTGNAKANQVYTAKITLTAKTAEGENFANSVTAPSGYTLGAHDAERVVLTRTFAKTGDKDAPVCVAPTGVTATFGSALSTITLTNPTSNTAGKWYWMDNTQKVGNVKENPHTYKAKFVPTDTENFATVENIDVTVTATQVVLSTGSPIMIPIEVYYTGSAIEPTPKIMTELYGDELVLNQDYKITKYEDNTNVGNGKIFIAPLTDGNYSFTAGSYTFTIKAGTSSISITGDPSKTYDGNVVADPAVSKSGSAGAVTYTYYTDAACTTKTTFANNGAVSDGTAPKNAGDYWVQATLAADSNHSSATSAAKNFTISPKALTSDMIMLGTQNTYNGTEQSVAISAVKDGTVSLIAGGHDYKVVSGNKAVNVGNNTLIIEGTGNYKGTAQKDWTLVAKDVTITPKALSKTYGEADPELTYTTDLTGDLATVFNNTKSGKLAYTGTNVGSYPMGLGTLEAGNNFNLKLANSEVVFTINQATPAITATTPRQLVKNGIEVDISGWASFTNTDSGAKLTYTLEGTPAGITLSADNKLKAANEASTVTTFNIKVTAAATTNFAAPTEKVIVVNVVEKTDAGVSITGAPSSKTYGDANFTLTATKTAPDGGTWNWNSSNPAILEIVSGADTATPIIKVKQANDTGATLTVTYTSSTHYGSANATITVDPKTLTAADLTHSGPITKVYDANTDAPTGLIVSVKPGSLVGTDTLAVTGTLKYNSANVNEADKITFTPNAITNGNYRIAESGELTIANAKIAAKEVTLTGGISATDRGYVKDNRTVALTKGALSFTGLVENETLDVNIPATGTISDAKVGKYDVAYSGVTLVDGTGKASNYSLGNSLPTVTVNITKAAAPTLADITVNQKYSATVEQQSKDIGNAGMPDDAGTLAYTAGTPTSGTAPVSNFAVDNSGKVKYAISGNAGSVVTLPVTISSDNYADAAVNVTITITKAKPSGTPGYTAITAEGKTLEDAALGVGTIAPAGTIKWVDADGAEMAETTPVEANKNYAWKFVPTDTTNYEELTGSIQLWHKSTGGKYYYSSSSDSGKATASAVLTAKDAKSATDYTSGVYGLTFRSTADFSGFKGIKVDGKTVDKKNYIAENNGGIEVYLKAAYLKTLADGRHTLTIMAAGGNASIDFTIGGVNTAPKTFDTGIAMYVTMAVASVTGMAWLGKKKEN